MKVTLSIEAGSIEELFQLFVAPMPRIQAAAIAEPPSESEPETFATGAPEPETIAATEPEPAPEPAKPTPAEKPARTKKTKTEGNGAAKAETAPAKPATPPAATRQDMRDQQTAYATAFGMDAALEDTIQLLNMRCPGQGFTKLSQVPDELVARVAADFADMKARNPFKRELEA